MTGSGWDRSDPDHPQHVTPPTQRRRKDTRHWCRGKEGVEHDLYVTVSHHGPGPCRAFEHGWSSWLCRHVIACRKCDKILDQFLGVRCPGIPDEERPRLLYEEYTARVRRQTAAAWVRWDDLPSEAQARWEHRAHQIMAELPPVSAQH